MILKYYREAMSSNENKRWKKGMNEEIKPKRLIYAWSLIKLPQLSKII